MSELSPAEGAAAILEGASIVGALVGWPVRIGGMSDALQEVVFIDQPGRTPEIAVAADYPALQLIVKSLSYSNGWNKSRDIYNALHGIPTPDASYPELTSCLARTNIAPLGQNEKNAFQFSLNFNLIVTPTVVGHRINA